MEVVSPGQVSVNFEKLSSSPPLTLAELREELSVLGTQLQRDLRETFCEELRRVSSTDFAHPHGSEMTSLSTAAFAPTHCQSQISALDDVDGLDAADWHCEHQLASENSTVEQLPALPAPRFRRMRTVTKIDAMVARVEDRVSMFMISERMSRFLQKFAKCVLRGELGDIVAFLVICANAATIAMQVDHLAQNPSSDPPHIFEVLELGFFCFYVLELTVRVVYSRRKFFLRWLNLFDVFLVAIQLVDLVIPVITAQVNSVNMLRFFRVFRALRVLRVVRFSNELLKLIYLLTGSIVSFIWSAVMILILSFITAIFLTRTSVGTGSASVKDADRIKHWGSLGRSVWTLYMSIMGGVDWGPAAESLDDTLAEALFSVYIAFVVLVLLNLVTGVFVSTAEKMSDNDKQMKLERGLRRALRKVNLTMDEPISREKFQLLLEHRGMVKFMLEHHLDKGSVLKVFELLQQRNGLLSPQAFLSFVLRLEGFGSALELARMHLQGDRSRLMMRTMLVRGAHERSQLLEMHRRFAREQARSDQALAQLREMLEASIVAIPREHAQEQARSDQALTYLREMLEDSILAIPHEDRQWAPVNSSTC